MAILHAQHALQHSAILPMLHLRDINPYVAAGLMEAGSSRTAAIARMSASNTSLAGNPACGGVSAFAFQVFCHQYTTISAVLSILNDCVSLSDWSIHLKCCEIADGCVPVTV